MTMQQITLDDIFSALAHEHRREIVLALGYRPHSISSLAEIFDS